MVGARVTTVCCPVNHAPEGGSAPRLVSRILPLLGAIAIGAGMLGLVELCFRTLASGALPAMASPAMASPAIASRVAEDRVCLPVLVPGTDGAGRAVYRVGDARIPVQQIPRDKPAHGYRVFLFGGSAAAGVGFGPNARITAHLQRMLAARMPDRTVEVVDLAIAASSSNDARLLLQDVCERHEPDLVLVHSGNDEFRAAHADRLAPLDAAFRRREADGAADVRDAACRGGSENVDLSEAEIARTVDAHADNVERMVAAAEEHGVDIVLMTVASNWRWRGREDLDAGWLGELFGTPGACTAAEWPRAVELLDVRVAESPPLERHEWLFKRAVARERMGQMNLARADYRAALAADPSRRRALEVMNDRVRAIAARRDVPLVDAVELLAARTATGILGFESFYDDVHLTPRGSVLLAGEVMRVLEEHGRLAPEGAAATLAYVTTQVCRFEKLQIDPLAADEWLGLGFDVHARMADRDASKYERLLREMDARIAADANDGIAHVYRGNFHFFRVGGEAQAERDWRRALELLGEQADVARNLELLRARGRS
jgi:lysophospholipase L1-like esterase